MCSTRFAFGGEVRLRGQADPLGRAQRRERDPPRPVGGMGEEAAAVEQGAGRRSKEEASSITPGSQTRSR